MMRIRRVSALACTAALVFSLLGCQSKDPAQEQAAFDEFMEQMFVDAMESDYTTAHVYLQDPSAYGIDADAIEVNLGSRFDEASMQAAEDAFMETYAEFQQFDRELLSEEQQDVYDIYAFEADLTEQLYDDKFDYYPQLFESMSGLQFQLPSLFSDWEIRSEDDVKDLILLLNDVKPYVDSALDYTRTQEEKGLLMVDARSVMDYCEGILNSGTDSSILSAMQEQVAALDLSEEATRSYQQQLADAFSGSFLPAYQDIYDTMAEFRDSENNNTQGLAAFPNGKEYYALILQQSIGSNQSVEDVQAMMDSAFEDHLTELQTIMFTDMEGVEPLVNGEELPSTGYTSYDAILQAVSARMSEDFPEVSNLNYHIEDMNEEIASDGIAAYFNIPSLDGDSIKQMRVNPDGADPGSLSTYLTVSHEGFPGHMYQYAYLYENVDSNYVKTLANVSAYVEGYAVYAEYESLHYLDTLNESLTAAYRENELASYCLYIQADIGIHYEGWDISETQDYFNETGIVLSDEDAQLVYDQLQANPAAFQPYYVGYHEFAALREKAEEALGDRFENKAFNEAILESGIAPFSVVERHVDAYIAAAQEA